MSVFVDALSDGFDNFEKCGDVVVSPKNNMVGLFCHFCSDIYTNLSEFLHHLQWMHNDVLEFSKPHDVYSIEELLSSRNTNEDIESQANSSNSTDSGIPTDAAEVADDGVSGERGVDNNTIRSIEMNESILSALASYEVDYEITRASNKMDYPKNGIGWHTIDAVEDKSEVVEVRDILAEVEQQLLQDDPLAVAIDLRRTLKEDTDIKENSPKIRIDGADAASHKPRRGRPPTKLKSDKPKLICDYKSYAIARLARTREQQRLHNVKRRILSSLKDDSLRLPLQPANKEMGKNERIFQLNPQKQPLKMKLELPPAKDENSSLEIQNKYKAPLYKEVKEEKICSSDEVNLKSNEQKSFCKTEIKTENIVEDHIKTDKLCHLKKPDDFNIDMAANKQNPESVRFKRTASANLDSVAPVVAKLPTRRPSFSETLERKPIKMEKSSEHINDAQGRSSLNFDLSKSVVEFLEQDLKTSLVSADSLLKLAEPSREPDAFESILKQISNEKKDDQKQTKLSTAETPTTGSANQLRKDHTLLKEVGLNIVKHADCEDLKPIDFVDALREKAAKFTSVLKKYNIGLNPKKLDSQSAEKRLEDFANITKEVNADLKIELTVGELRRILNLINSWHAHHIDLKFFRKVELSSTIEHYLQLFAFMPKINRFVYYCEWCDESSSNKSVYEKHRMTHLCIYVCPTCQRGFKKQGFLLNHMRMLHGQEK